MRDLERKLTICCICSLGVGRSDGSSDYRCHKGEESECELHAAVR
jgi:hypothetical protein